MVRMYRKGGLKQAAFIIRFDDLCPEMNTYIWEQIEDILYRYDIKPIIAVVPNNQDEKLMRNVAAPLFWSNIKKYQNDGFMVALHGYNHVYQNKASGIMGISRNSEFARVPYEEQRKKILDGISIFKEHQINPDAFIAPSHSFDNTTLKALKGEISVISDGHLRYPYQDKGFLWIPCQIWDRLRAEKSGLYTVCIHPNNWTEQDVCTFEKDVKKFRDMIISPFEIVDAKPLTAWGKLSTFLLCAKLKLKNQVKRIIKL